MQQPFPQKLYEILNDSNYKDIIQWLETPKNGFKIIDVTKFTNSICSIYFKHTKMTSFQRQLNLYGFRRDMEITGHLAYIHPLFVNGNFIQVTRIRRASRSHPGPLQLYKDPMLKADDGSSSSSEEEEKVDLSNLFREKTDTVQTKRTFGSMVFDIPAICESPRRSTSTRVSSNKRSFEDSSDSSSFDDYQYVNRSCKGRRFNNKGMAVKPHPLQFSHIQNNEGRDTVLYARNPTALPRLSSFANDPINFLETAIQTCRSNNDDENDDHTDKVVPIDIFGTSLVESTGDMILHRESKAAIDNAWANSSLENAYYSSSSSDDSDSLSFVIDAFFDNDSVDLTDALLLQ